MLFNIVISLNSSRFLTLKTVVGAFNKDKARAIVKVPLTGLAVLVFPHSSLLFPPTAAARYYHFCCEREE